MRAGRRIGVNVARPSSPLQFAYRELCGLRMILLSLGVSCVWVLFFTVAGPGFDVLPEPAPRVAFFGSIAALTWPFGHSAAIALLHCLRHSRIGFVVLAFVAAGLYHAANIATVGYALYSFVMPDGPPPPSWLLFYVRAAVASVGHYALLLYIAVLRARLGPVMDRPYEAAPSPTSEPTQPARFLDRLPGTVGRDVVYLKVNGHYIHVTTTAGSASVLMRFADAVEELGDLGLQVHRSFWVASRHVTEIARHDNRTVVRVTGGSEVPVSRTFLAAVRKLAADKGHGIPRQRERRPAQVVQDTEPARR